MFKKKFPFQQGVFSRCGQDLKIWNTEEKEETRQKKPFSTGLDIQCGVSLPDYMTKGSMGPKANLRPCQAKRLLTNIQVLFTKHFLSLIDKKDLKDLSPFCHRNGQECVGKQ